MTCDWRFLGACESHKVESFVDPNHLLLHSLLDGVGVVEKSYNSYGSEFSRAVEHKHVAQQEVERSKFVVMKAEQERQAAIICAEGESVTAKLISDAGASAVMGLIELGRIEASREIAFMLAKSLNVLYLPGGQNLMMALNTSR